MGDYFDHFVTRSDNPDMGNEYKYEEELDYNPLIPSTDDGDTYLTFCK